MKNDAKHNFNPINHVVTQNHVTVPRSGDHYTNFRKWKRRPQPS